MAAQETAHNPLLQRAKGGVSPVALQAREQIVGGGHATSIARWNSTGSVISKRSLFDRSPGDLKLVGKEGCVLGGKLLLSLADRQLGWSESEVHTGTQAPQSMQP